MKERPILFSGPMVRAILDGTKTQTRRVAKRLRGLLPADWEPCSAEEWPLPSGPRLPGLGYQVFRTHDETGYVAMECPYGAPGDRLWVREAWRLPIDLDARSGAQVGAAALDAGYPRPWAPTQYEADGRRTGEWAAWPSQEPGRYRQARFMPRWASRLSLEITDVRVERLQEITEDDARAEGVEAIDGCGHPAGDDGQSAHEVFRDLWDSINVKRAPWASNPWVWAITFERCS